MSTINKTAHLAARLVQAKPEQVFKQAIFCLIRAHLEMESGILFSVSLWQNAGVSEGPVSRRISQEAMRGGCQDEVKRKKKEERETGEGKSQSSQAGCSSLSRGR